MSKVYLPIAPLLLALAIATFTVGCSSKAKKDELVPASELQAADLVQTEDVLFAVRMDFKGLPQAVPLLEALADNSQSDVPKDLAAAAEDPLKFLARRFNFPQDLPALNKDQPGYLLLTHRGNEEVFTAARLGLLTEPEEWPHYLNIRLLLPTKSPEKLSEELQSQTTEGPLQKGLFFEGGDFLRVELAIAASKGDEELTTSWLNSLELDRLQPPSSAERRPTPAFKAFIEEEAQLGLWLPMKSLPTLTAFEMTDLFRREYNQVGPAGKPRFHIEGVSRIAASAIAADPMSAENEDMALLLSGQNKDILAIDYITSHTSRGVAIAQARQTSIELPKLNTEDPFLVLNWQDGLRDPEAVQVAPRWSSISGVGEQASFEALAQGRATGVLPVDKKTNLPELAAFLQYPSTYMTRNLAQVGSGDTLPLAATIQAFPSASPESSLPIGAALVAVFPQNIELRAQLEQWLAIGQMFLPMAFDATLHEREGLLELRAVLGADLETIFPAGGSMDSARSTDLSLDLLKLQESLPMIPSQNIGEHLDKLHVTTGDDPRYGSIRLLIGADSPQAPLQLDPQIEPLQNPTTRCETDIAALAVEMLNDLRTDAQAQVEAWAQAVESLASECVDPTHPAARIIKERVHLTRQRAQEIP